MTRIRKEIRRPYDKTNGKLGEPIKREHFNSDSDYFEAALNVLNRDVGVSHAKIRFLWKVVAAQMTLIGSLILIALKAKLGQ